MADFEILFRGDPRLLGLKLETLIEDRDLEDRVKNAYGWGKNTLDLISIGEAAPNEKSFGQFLQLAELQNRTDTELVELRDFWAIWQVAKSAEVERQTEVADVVDVPAPKPLEVPKVTWLDDYTVMVGAKKIETDNFPLVTDIWNRLNHKRGTDVWATLAKKAGESNLNIFSNFKAGKVRITQDRAIRWSRVTGMTVEELFGFIAESGAISAEVPILSNDVVSDVELVVSEAEVETLAEVQAIETTVFEQVAETVAEATAEAPADEEVVAEAGDETLVTVPMAEASSPEPVSEAAVVTTDSEASVGETSVPALLPEVTAIRVVADAYAAKLVNAEVVEASVATTDTEALVEVMPDSEPAAEIAAVDSDPNMSAAIPADAEVAEVHVDASVADVVAGVPDPVVSGEVSANTKAWDMLKGSAIGGRLYDVVAQQIALATLTRQSPDIMKLAAYQMMMNVLDKDGVAVVRKIDSPFVRDIFQEMSFGDFLDALKL